MEIIKRFRSVLQNPQIHNDWQQQVFGRLGETAMRDLGIRRIGSDVLSYNFNYARMIETAIMRDSDYKTTCL